MATPFIAKLHLYAQNIEKSLEAIPAETRQLWAQHGKNVEAAAHDIETKLERWLGLVDDHLEHWADEAIVKAKAEAFAVYQAAKVEAAKLLDHSPTPPTV